MDAYDKEKDLNETARLLMMEQRDNNERLLSKFHKSMKEVYPDLSMKTSMLLWDKYMGWDRRLPTHDIDTGKVLR